MQISENLEHGLLKKYNTLFSTIQNKYIYIYPKLETDTKNPHSFDEMI